MQGPESNVSYFVTKNEIQIDLSSFKDLSRSSTSIEYTFNNFLYSKCSLNKKLLNIYSIEVDERNISVE